MLVRLGNLLRAGPPNRAVAVLLGLLLLARLVPGLALPLLFAAGAAAALLALTRAPRESLLLLPASVVRAELVALGGALLSGAAAPIGAAGFGYIAAAFVLLPALLALLLRRAGLPLTVLGGFAGGWALAWVVRALHPGVDALWAAALRDSAAQLQTQGQPELAASLNAPLMAAIGVEMVIAAVMLLAVLSLLAARAWQSTLSEQPFFRAELRSIRFGRYASGAFLAVLALAAWSTAPAALGLAAALLPAFLLQAAATAHRLADRMPTAWLLLAPFYVLLLIRQEFALAFSVAGAVDNLLGLSARLPSRPA